MRYKFGAGQRGRRLLTIATALLLLAAMAPSAGAQPGPPSVSVDPSAGVAGEEVTVSGSGFIDDDCVDVRLVDGEESRLLATAFPDSGSGSFTVEATIPTDVAPGGYAIEAVGTVLAVEFCGPESGNVAATNFTVRESSGLEPRFVPIKPDYTDPLPVGFSETEVHLKFVQGTDIRGDDGELASAAGHDLSEVLDVLAGVPSAEVSRLFDARSVDELAAEKARLETRSGREQGDKNLYFRVSFPAGTDRVSLLNQLNALDIVELAYPVGDEPPPPSHADYRPQQGYRLAAGSGIHADAANLVPGGRGQNVQVTDIEGAFLVAHEDLPAVTIYDNGAMFGAANWVNHGTAVMGMMFGVDNGFGVLGLVPDAAPAFVAQSGGRANAIDVAAANSSAGDVILLEMQTTGANGGCTAGNQTGCVPQEYDQASYDATVAAVAAGIIVVGAAGNGSENLDSAAYGPTFGSRPDSGAIIVGAGAAGSDDSWPSVGNQNGPTCNDPERSRLNFSTFGSRVDAQGWGECVMSTGYGFAEGSSASTDSYRASFSGTSSASPFVASAAAILSSVAIENGDADGLTSTEARAIIVATGTPQDLSPGANTGNIGPLPNLAAALGLEADVSISKTADVDPVVAGEALGYDLTVTNSGPNVATDVVVTDNLPPGTVLLLPTDPACTPDGSDLVCDVGTLGVGESVMLEVDIFVPDDTVFNAGGPTTITNTALVTSTIDDPNAGNNTTAVDVGVVAEADLEIIYTDVLAPPVEAMIGDDIVLTLQSFVENNGPSSPMNAELLAVANPSAGLSVLPGADVAFLPALDVGNPQLVDQVFTVQCTAPGVQTVTFDTTVAPADAADTDPFLANNDAQASFDVECIVPIVINVRPGNKHNRINTNSNGRVPVAALTTEAGEYGLPVAFDATLIVPGSVRFGEQTAVYDETGGAANVGRVHVRDWFELDDKTKDGDDDMRMRFVSSATDLTAGDTTACMRGQYLDGGVLYTFFGCDTVKVR